MKELIALMMLSELVQHVTQQLKLISDKYTAIVSMIVGISVAVVAQVDIFEYLGFQVVSKIAGQVLTGIIMSGGASILYETLKKWGFVKNDNGGGQ